jgi:DNA-binding NarL/FixJ family response regulator
VEDERIIAIDLRRRLTSLCYTVVATAGSGAEALTQARALRSGLHGHRLAGVMTGLETGGRIWVVCTIPIVYVLAYAGEPTSIQTNTSTPGLAVCKSFDTAQLETILAQALAAHR